MKSGTRALLALLVLQAVLVSAAVAESNGVGTSAAKKKACCSSCTSWSGVYTCDDLLTKCAATCKNCAAVPTDKGTRYRCRDFLPEGCPCKA
ncbi:Bowman-Birk type wound-induced proteinase inhibitor WIP1-like [Panicum virgatum]|uniref:Bowman-Birk serine protease inhibitors family domain-containing protein n=1 Tax=Panicum virgatum TaxID=38727 RepID=A0A8T0RLU9_PANVG|nr:Bowman-Birk type wound-induced proteinase inhibitor WIP1-like [Panicum virgatum]KAG2587242.1 hypothetical protein PVAP13_5NG127500 [Panicum virgatum]